MNFADIVRGTTSTIGTGSYVIDGTVPYAPDPNVELTDGERYQYFVQHDTAGDAGYEFGWGIYDAAADTLTRNVEKSSNSDALVDWTFGTKLVSIVASSQMLTQWVSPILQLRAGQALGIVSTGQSQCGHASVLGDAENIPAPNPNIQSWQSTTGVVSETKGWVVPDATDVKTNDISPTVGLMGGINGASTDSTHIAWELGNMLQQFFGVDVYLLNVYWDGYPINGWKYDPGSGNVAEEINDQFAAANAALPAGVSVQWRIGIFWQGPSDAWDSFPGTSLEALPWAEACRDFVDDCWDSARWGWAPEDFVWYVPENSYRAGRKYNARWNGHAILNAITDDRVCVVPMLHLSNEEYTYDRVHWFGEVHQILAKSLFRMIAFGTSLGVSTSESMLLVDDTLDMLAQYTLVVDSDAAPAAGEMHINAAQDRVRMSKTLEFGYGVTDHQRDAANSGVGNLGTQYSGAFLERDAIRLTAGATPDSNYTTFDTDSVARDGGDYWEWDIINFTVVGAGASGTVSMFCDNRFPRSTKYPRAHAQGSLSVENLRQEHVDAPIFNDRRYGTVIVDIHGRLQRTYQTPRTEMRKTFSGTTGFELAALILVSDGDHFWFDASLMMRDTGSGELGRWTMKGYASRTGGTLTLSHDSVTEELGLTGVAANLTTSGTAIMISYGVNPTRDLHLAVEFEPVFLFDASV